MVNACNDNHDTPNTTQVNQKDQRRTPHHRVGTWKWSLINKRSKQHWAGSILSRIPGAVNKLHVASDLINKSGFQVLLLYYRPMPQGLG